MMSSKEAPAMQRIAEGGGPAAVAAALPGIYIHIPFCVRKCRYCAFLSGPATPEAIEKYVEALESEMRWYGKEAMEDSSDVVEAEQVSAVEADSRKCGASEADYRGSGALGKMDDRVFDSIYFGGGTPSILEPAVIGRLIRLARECFSVTGDAEITLEVNPGTLGEDEASVRKRLMGYKEAGVNRLSMGVQSMDNERLMFLGRIHSAEEVARDFALARDCGFSNISLDLITAAPGMSLEDALSDIRKVAALGPDHISMYTLQLEEGTPLYKAWERGDFEMLTDEEDRKMYHEGVKLLKELEYERYEISSFARTKAKRSRHNSKYWCMAEYLGLGLGASGYINNTRYVNTQDMAEYLKGHTRSEEHSNTKHDTISESVFTGLRRSEGIHFEEVMSLAGMEATDFMKYYADVRADILEFQEDGYLILDDEGMKLTDKGIDISNTIMALFV